MAKFFLETYGCQMNLADSELIAGILHQAGWREAAAIEEADAILINTCAVRERAAARVIGHVRSYRPLIARRPRMRIVMAGCLARYDGAALADRLPEVDLFVGPDGYRCLPELLADNPASGRLAIRQDRAETYASIRPRRRPGVNAWVSVMRGCDQCCAYCVVPFARGRERSLPGSQVLAAVLAAVADGYPSITLLGQKVTSYRHGSLDFADLLGEVAAVAGVRRIRFLSPHPADFDARLLERIARHDVICPHLHLPVQSGSDRVLTAMRRGYCRSNYLSLIEAAREAKPGLAVTTDLIAGFPGEQADDFAATLDLMRAARFDSAFMFVYSERPRTYAARYLVDDVSPGEKQRRIAALIALQESHSRERFAAQIGGSVTVLVEGAAQHPTGWYFGKTADFKDAVFSPLDGAALVAGAFVTVRVTAATSHTLLGEMKPDLPQGNP